MSIKRKKAIDRVKGILVLNEYIAHLKATVPESERIVIDIPRRIYEKLEVMFPLKVRKLEFRRWMLRHLFDVKQYKEFIADNKRSDELEEIELHDIMCMTAMKFDVVVQHVLRASNYPQSN